MQNTKQPDGPGIKPVNNDTDVNQTDHISSQLDKDDENIESNTNKATEDSMPVNNELEDITDEETGDKSNNDIL
jgi:hypothetical protein